MNLLGADKKTGKLLCFVKVELGGVTGGFALRAESADLWHRRMGHINRRRMGVMRKQPGNGIEYTGDNTGMRRLCYREEQTANSSEAGDL